MLESNALYFYGGCSTLASEYIYVCRPCLHFSFLRGGKEKQASMLDFFKHVDDFEIKFFNQGLNCLVITIIEHIASKVMRFLELV